MSTEPMQFLRERCCSLLTVLAIALSGCGNGETSIDPAKLSIDRPRVDSTRLARGKLALPSGEPFNLTAFESGQEGDARGASSAVGTNGATCTAETTGVGTAHGSFLLGYTFDNGANTPVEAIVRLRLKHEATIQVPAQTARTTTRAAGESRPGGRTSLAFIIKDSVGVVLKNEPLAASTDRDGAGSSTGTHELAFDARFEPQRGYYLMLAAECETTGGADQPTRVALEVSECSMEIEWSPARPGANTRTSMQEPVEP